MSLEPGTLLNERYRIDKILGHGGMGAVYLATDESLGIQCALKENLNLSPESERQFKREATLLASLRHPNLPRVTNHFILGNQQYLVMDFVEGEDLKERMEQEGRLLDEADVLRWGEQICYALTYLHGLNPPIVHRDIKPANIKITPSGEAILVDFGIAKSGASGQKTTTGAVGLTPGFAPPEQYSTGHTDARTDEYALAATLYNLLTGVIPSDSVERLLGNKTMTPPQQLRPDLSPHVAAALTHAMEINPDRRFDSVATFQDALMGRLPIEQIAAPETVTPDTLLGEAALPTQAGRTVAGAPATVPAETAEAKPRARRIGCGWVLWVAVILWVITLVALVVSPISPTALIIAQFPTPTPISHSTPTSEAATPTPTPAAIAHIEATATPTETLAPTFTPIFTPTPTRTPEPKLISAENAASWRVFNQWSAGGSSSVPFALGPDGKTVAFPKEQGVDIFDLTTGQTVQRLQGFIVNEQPVAVAYLPDSLLVQFADRILRWDIPNNSLRESFKNLPGHDLAVSPAGTWMAIRDKYVTVMNIETRRAFTVGKENSQQSYAFSPDDKYLALTNGAVVELYSLASGKLDHRLSGHGKPTSGLAFTKDGTKLVSASGDVWDMTNPAATDPVVIFDTAADLQQVAVSPDGQVIVGSDGTVWEATGGKRIGRLPGVSGQMARVAFSPDGLFVITQSGGDTLQLWAIGEPGQAGGVTNEIAAAPPEREGITPLNVARIAQLNQLGDGYDGVAFSPDGRTAAGWSRSGVDLLGLAAGEKLFSLGVSGGISNTAYIGGGFLLIAYQRGGVERWDLAEQRLKQAYDATGTALKVSRDGKLFALQGKYIQVVDVLSGKFLYQALGTADSAQDFEFTPDGRYLVVASKQSVNVLDMQDHARQVRVLSTHGADPTSLVFNADGSRLVSASGDVWDLTSTGGKPMATFESTTDVVTISPEGTLILGGDGSLWDAANGQFIGQLAGLEGRLTHAAFTPEGQSILWRTDSGAVMAEGIKSAAQGARVTVSLPDTSRESISAANAARLGLVGWWGKDDLLSLRLLKDAPAGQFTQFDGGQYTGLARHSDGNLLAGVTRAGVELIDLNQAKIVGAFSNFLNVDTILEAAYRGDELMVNKQRAGVERWDLATGELKQRYNVTGASLVVSPDGKRFAIYRDNVVQVLEVESGHVVFSQRAANAQGNFEFSPDESHLALADGLFVGLWNLETGKRERNLRGHTLRVGGLAFTPEGKKLISASGDIWDLEANKLAAQFDTAATRVAVSPDGQIIAANDGGLWEAATGKRLGTLTEMRGVADQLAFAANGQFLLGQTDKDVIYVWGIRPAPPPVALPSDAQIVVKGNAAGLTRQSLWGRGRLVSGVWSPDDKYLAVNTTENVIVYESDGLKPVRVVWEAMALTFNASDQLLIGGAHELQLMEVTSGQVVKTFEQSGHPLQGIQSAAFSPDGKQLGIGGQLKSDGKPDGLAVIDLADGLVGVLKDSLGFGGPVAKIEFAADNNTLVAFTFNPVSLSGVITIWDIQKRGRVREPITNVTKLPTLSPEGKFIAFYDGRILMIQNLLKGGIARGDIHGDGTPHVQTSTTIDPLALITYAYTTDGRVLAFYHTLKANQLAVVRWLIDPTSADVTLQESRYGVDLDNFTGLYADDYTNPRLPLTPAFGLSPGNTRFFSLTADGIVRVWDFQANALAASPADDMELMALSPDGKTAAVPNAVGGIEIVDLASGQAVKTVAGAWYPVKLVYDSASVLAIWHGENQLTFWDLNQNQPIEEYSGERFNNPGFFTLSQDGRLFAVWNRSASKDNLNVFALNSSQPLFDFGRYPKPAPMRFSPDDRYLAVVNNKAVDVWDLQTGQKVTLEGQSKAIGELAFSADGTRLVSATGEIWDVANGKLAATFDVPKELASVALSPNGQVIVGNEGSLWDAATGQPIDVLKNTRGPALSQTFTPDGRQLIRQTKAGVIEVWGISP